MKHFPLIVALSAAAFTVFASPLTLESSIKVPAAAAAVPAAESADAPLKWQKGMKYLAVPDVKQGTPYSNTGKAIARSGAISMWVSPNWNGDANSDNHYVFSLQNHEGKEVLPFWFWAWLRADIPTDGGKESINSRFRNEVVKGDWIHILLAWNQRYRTSLYVNGELLNTKRFTGTRLDDVKNFFIGSNVNGRYKFDGIIEDVRLYRKAPSEKDIRALWFSRNIFDFAVDRTLMAPGKNEIAFAIAPLGTFSGKKYDRQPDKAASGTLSAVLKDEQGKIILKKDFGSLSIRKFTPVSLGKADLKSGEYYLTVNAGNSKKQQSRTFRLYVTAPHTPANSPDGDLRIGKEIFSHSFEKFEAGSQKNQNIFCEVTFPKELIGKQTVIEITYPDDRTRAMAWYMHTPKTSQSTIRDRLGAGVYSGEEFPVSGKDQKMRYLFEIGFENYLFEARTLISGRPAAVKKIAVYTVDAPLPELKLNLPAGMRGRQIGHMDEDQSFDYNLGWDNMRPKMHKNEVDPAIVRKLIEYFKYTGQNYFTLPLLRYQRTVYSNSGMDGYNGTFPFRQGSIPYYVETLADHGISFVCNVNFYNAPRFGSDVYKQTLERQGFFAQRNDGSRLRGAPFNPEHEKAVLYEIENFLRRFGKLRGMRGVDLWLEFDCIGFRSLEHGYDETTVKGFTDATGIKVPEFEENACQKRYEFLTSGKIREKWISYRVKRTTALIAEIRKIIDRYNPDLELYITVSGTLFRGNKHLSSTESMDVVKDMREEQCVDIAALQKLPRTYVSPMRFPLMDIWNMHWDLSISTAEESMWNRKFSAPFLRDDRNFATLYRYYFESFAKTPMNSKYPGFFQNSDPKPAGRNFLKEFALTLALTDASRISAGAQPLAPLGCEDLFREFAKAYRALPEAAFKSVRGVDDPVTVRYLSTANGTYLYAVNMIGETVSVQLPECQKMTDLSTGKSSGNTFTLKPYELRSFLFKSPSAVTRAKITVPPRYIERAAKKLADISKTVAELIEAGNPMDEAVAGLKAARKAFDAGKFAEFDRQINRKCFRSMATLIAANKSGYLKQHNQMVKSGHIAVNCGSSKYFRTASGKLFFPDQPFANGKNYGFLGGSGVRSVIHNVDIIPNSEELKELYSSELFCISGYKFKVSPGTYDMKLYMRVGYPPSRKPGIFRVDISVNGRKIRENFDIFLNEKNGYGILDIPGIRDVKGEITLSILNRHPSNTVCLLNGIEIFRSKTK